MPSLLHEGLISLIRERPEFVADLLRQLLHVDVPRFTEARLAEASLNELVPVEYHADAVVLFVDGRPVFGSIFEAQLQADERKRYTWPMYELSARARYECPFVLIVVTPDAAAAQWASRNIELAAGRTWWPLVVGPEGIPVITDAEEARRDPELTVLSVMAHGKGDDQTAASMAFAAMEALKEVPAERGRLYLVYIRKALGDAARKAFDMHPQNQKILDEYERPIREEARVAEKAVSVLEFLDARGLVVTSAQRERILACKELQTLRKWVRQAATVTSVDELFA